MEDSPIPYDPYKGFSFENASAEQAVFENELEANEIKYFKKESMSLNMHPRISYSVLPKDLNDANKIFENIYKNRTLVPEKRVVVLMDILGTWVTRILIIAVLILIVFIVITHFTA
jgi:hypothetical protein